MIKNEIFRKDSQSIYIIPLYIITFSLILYIFYIGSGFIIDFIIALLFSFAIIALSNFYAKFKLPHLLASFLSWGTYIFIFWIIGKMIGNNVALFIEELPHYQNQIIEIIHNIFTFFGIPEPKSINEVINNFDLQEIFKSVLDTVTSIFSSAGIIMFYVMFILLEHRYFKHKLNLMITNQGKRKEVFLILEKIRNDMKSYFYIKTIISFFTGFLSYLVMFAFNLPFADFFGFLIFILNFIPNIGTIIALFLVFTFSLVGLDSYYDMLIMASLLIGIETMMGNIIEPKFMGNKLNLSPLVIILALGFWGLIWGVVGMLLSVPIMVIINIILAKIPATRPIAILMSEKGDLEVDGGEEVIKHRRNFFNNFKEKFVKK